MLLPLTQSGSHFASATRILPPYICTCSLFYQTHPDSGHPMTSHTCTFSVLLPKKRLTKTTTILVKSLGTLSQNPANLRISPPPAMQCWFEAPFTPRIIAGASNKEGGRKGEEGGGRGRKGEEGGGRGRKGGGRGRKGEEGGRAVTKTVI